MSKEREIPERWVICRQLAMNPRQGFQDNMGFTSGKVPGRVLDIAREELLSHMPHLHDDLRLDLAVEAIFLRLAKSENFDFEKSMDADRRWKRGMYGEKKT